MFASNCLSSYVKSYPLTRYRGEVRLMLLALLILGLCTGACGQWFGQILTDGPFFATPGQVLMLEVGPATAGDGADIAIGDLDGDGVTDLLAGSLYGDLVYYQQLANRRGAAPQALLGENTEIWRWPPPHRQASPELADWNGDGKLDLILGYGSQLFWYQRQGLRLGIGRPLQLSDGRAVAEVIHETSPTAGPLAPCVADVDGDGDIDLLLGADDGRVWWIENEAVTGSPKLAIPQMLGAGGAPVKVAGRARVCVGDYNGDGRQDLIIGDAEDHLWWCSGLPAGLQSPQQVDLPRRPSATAGGVCPRFVPSLREIWLGDADGFIGRLAMAGNGQIQWEGYLTAEKVPLDVGQAAAVCALDWDADGDLDLIAGNAAGEVTMYERVGSADGCWLKTGRSIATTTGSLQATGGYAWPRLADADGDGDVDLLLGTGAGIVELWLNSGGFVPAGAIKVAGRRICTAGPATVAAVDYDRDGDMDLFVGTKSPSGVTQASAAIPPGRVGYFENATNSRRSLPVFVKGTLLDMYIASSAGTAADLDARVLGPQLAEPINGHSLPQFIVTADLGIFLFGTTQPRRRYPFLVFGPTSDELAQPILPPA